MLGWLTKIEITFKKIYGVKKSTALSITYDTHDRLIHARRNNPFRGLSIEKTDSAVVIRNGDTLHTVFVVSDIPITPAIIRDVYARYKAPDLYQLIQMCSE